MRDSAGRPIFGGCGAFDGKIEGSGEQVNLPQRCATAQNGHQRHGAIDSVVCRKKLPTE
jgi:hypothetical protein